MLTDLQRLERVAPPESRIGVGWLFVAVLLVAANLRIAVTSLGALLDEVGRSTHMSGFAMAFATTLPVLAFAVVGAAGIMVTRRLGAHRGLALAMLLLVIGLFARVVDGTVLLLVGTLIACAGIALANVLLPAVVKEHFPQRIGQVTGAYSAVLSIGAAFGAATTVPLAGATGSWQGGLGIWGLLALLALVVWLPHCLARGGLGGPRVRTGMLRSPVAWAVTIVFGTQSLFAYVVMSWLPSVYADAGFSHEQAGLLLAGSIMVGVPVFFLAPTLATRLASQGHLIAVMTALMAIGFAGLWLSPAQGAWLWAVLLGVGGGVFPVTLALFALRTRTAADTASLSAMAQSIGYLIAAAGPLLVGVLRDATGSWSVPLALLVLLCVVQVVAGYAAGRPRVIGAPAVR